MVVGEFTTEVDVLVIGGGPGGYVAAIKAAQLGKTVTLVEKENLGGVCLNVGCVPSKALISASHRFEEAKGSEDMGIIAEGVKLDFSKVQAWKQTVVNKLTGGVAGLLKGNKVQVLEGEALFVSENEVRVFNGYDVNRYKFNYCIIATGSTPIEIPTFPFVKRVISSTGALNLTEVPKKMVVIGGGYIGVELGTAYAKFGTEVTIIEGADSVLSVFDKRLTQTVTKNLKKHGVDIVTKAMAKSVKETADGVVVTVEANGEEKSYEADYCLVTVGRKPNSKDIGLDAAGVKTDEKGFILVDDQCRTNVPNIYAIGDVVPGPALAHKASYEGKVAAEVIAGHKSAVDYVAIPFVVFSDPEIATVGLSEAEAKEKGYDIISGKFPFAVNGRALSLNQTDGFLKIIAEKDSQIVLGAEIIGPSASDLIAEIGLAIEMSATIEDIILTIHAHPTLGEVVMEAAEATLGQSIHMINK